MPMMLLLINKITFFFLHLAFCLSLRKFIAYGSRFPTSKLWVGTVGSLPALGSSAGGAKRAAITAFHQYCGENPAISYTPEAWRALVR